MLTVNTGSATVTATYDALGRMVENNAGGTYSEFIFGPTRAKLAEANGQTLVKAFVSLPGGATAIYKSSGLAYYRHSDWLGSSRLTSTASRTLYSSSAYAPFGERYKTSGTVDAAFTGQNSDTVSSLYDFEFRESSPSQGRWISPDPAGIAAVNPRNPQSWNRYAYVLNTPLILTDPFGLDTSSECIIVTTVDEFGSVHVEKFGDCGSVVGGGDAGLASSQGHPCSNPRMASCTAYLGPPNNHSWAWNFTKSFFTFAGGPGNVPTCAGQALRHIGEILNPFTPGASTAAEAAAPVAQAVAINQGIAQTQVGIDAYIATRGLTVPLRSSIVRTMAAEGAEGAVAAGVRANLAVQTIAVDYAAVNSTITTAGEARNGQCAAAFPIF